MRKQILAGLLGLAIALAATVGAPAAVYAAATPKEIINSAALSPQGTGNENLDKLVNKVLDKVTTDEMDTYEKVWACYRYLTKNMTYGAPWDHLDDKVGKETCGDIYFRTGEIEGLAALALKANVGFCNGYSSAFVVLCRAIGLDAVVAFGDIRASGGGYTDHKWAEIKIDGSTYLFDPQMEQQSTSWTGSDAYFFCTTYSKDPTMYRFSHRQGLSAGR